MFVITERLYAHPVFLFPFKYIQTILVIRATSLELNSEKYLFPNNFAHHPRYAGHLLKSTALILKTWLPEPHLTVVSPSFQSYQLCGRIPVDMYDYPD
jgi:hypothetical protein